MSTFPSASYDDWKLMSPDEEAERIFGPQDEDDDEFSDCDYCGGEGYVELADHPDLWEDDCLMEGNRLVLCPECQREGGDSDA